jgi:hypothetical protein
MVMSMRRVLSALAVFGVCATGLLAAGSASAAPSPSAPPYPPVTPPSVAVSTTSPCVGESIDVGGTGFAAAETVTLSIGGQSVGTATGSGAGSFAVSVKAPSVVGEQQLSAVGQSSGTRASATLTISNCSGVAGESANRGLAFTGVEIAGLCVLGAALISGGALFVAAGRRRRNSAVGV